MENQSPKVFLSYSWDSDQHKTWVLNLADKLVANGVNVTLDQYELKLGRNLTHFMERAVQDADKVLLIMTENFKLKAEGRQGGVGYEYSMINAEWYQNQTDNTKFIPVLRGEDRTASTPIFVNAFINLDMRKDSEWDNNIEELLRTIYNQLKIVKPKIGKRPNFVKSPTTDKTPQTPSYNSTENAIKAKRLAHNKAKVKTYIQENELEDALELLEKIANDIGKVKLQQEIIIHQSQYNQYKSDKQLSLKSDNELDRTKNKMVYNLLNLLEDIKL
jgi:hypothetical protein